MAEGGKYPAHNLSGVQIVNREQIEMEVYALRDSGIGNIKNTIERTGTALVKCHGACRIRHVVRRRLGGGVEHKGDFKIRCGENALATEEGGWVAIDGGTPQNRSEAE